MNKTKILIVDDRLENLIALETLLQNIDVEFIRALSGNDALRLSLEHDFALILIDVQMPEMNGFETVELMRSIAKTKSIPIIFLSAVYSDNFHNINGIESGTIDLITKPIVSQVLIGKVNLFLELYNQKKQLAKITAELEEALSELEKLHD